MDNLWINWRFGTRHLQIGPDKPYITFKVNPYYKNKKECPMPWFERY